MLEQSFRTTPHSPNRLTEFVIGHAPSFASLNAATPEEGNNKFTAAAIEALRASRVEPEVLGSGYFNRVHGLEDNTGVVIKRLQTRGYSSEQLSQLWQWVQNDYRTIVAYFGSRFIPDTEFLLVESGLLADTDNFHTDASGHQYVAVQERAVGENFHSLPKNFHASPELKQEVIEYIIRCERMMRDGILMDHPDDLMIDDSPDATRRVTLLDTNCLAKFTNIVNGRNSKVFLEEYGIDPASLRTPEDIMQMIRDMVPPLLGLGVHEAEELRNQAYPTLMNRLRRMEGDLSFLLQDALQRLPNNPQSIPPELKGNRFLDQLLFNGFDNLVALADRCAPAGHHPKVFTSIMDTFGIRDTDLATTH